MVLQTSLAVCLSQVLIVVSDCCSGMSMTAVCSLSCLPRSQADLQVGSCLEGGLGEEDNSRSGQLLALLLSCYKGLKPAIGVWTGFARLHA